MGLQLRAGNTWEALATIKHLIRSERQFPKHGNHRVQIQGWEGKASLWQLRSLLLGAWEWSHGVTSVAQWVPGMFRSTNLGASDATQGVKLLEE